MSNLLYERQQERRQLALDMTDESIEDEVRNMTPGEIEVLLHDLGAPAPEPLPRRCYRIEYNLDIGRNRVRPTWMEVYGVDEADAWRNAGQIAKSPIPRDATIKLKEPSA